MKRKFLSLMVSLVLTTLLPLNVWADSRTYTPPAEKGQIWIVIRHRKPYPPMDTKVSVNWGKWSKSASINPGGFRSSYDGVVIQLKHSKNDSVPLTVSTDGSIVSIFQGDAPSEASDSNWQKQSW